MGCKMCSLQAQTGFYCKVKVSRLPKILLLFKSLSARTEVSGQCRGLNEPQQLVQGFGVQYLHWANLSRGSRFWNLRTVSLHVSRILCGVIMVPNIEQDYILLSGYRIIYMRNIMLLGSTIKKTLLM